MRFELSLVEFMEVEISLASLSKGRQARSGGGTADRPFPGYARVRGLRYDA